MVRHYICKGECAGLAEAPGICKDQECSRFQQPLDPCECVDGQHNNIREREAEEDEE